GSGSPPCAGGGRENKSSSTGSPLSVASVKGVTNSRAARVRMTCTLWPRCCRRRTNSADLYAAMPPEMPSRTRMSGRLLLLRPAFGLRLGARRIHPAKVEQALHRLLLGDARGFAGTGWQQRPRSTLQLARPPRHHMHKQITAGHILNAGKRSEHVLPPLISIPGDVPHRDSKRSQHR